MADQIRDLLEEFAEKIRRAAIEEAFETMRASIVGGTAKRRGPGRPAGGRRAKGAKRDRKELDNLEKILISYISKHPGQRSEQIGKALRMSTKELMVPMRKLRAQKKIAMKGTRRAAKYFTK